MRLFYIEIFLNWFWNKYLKILAISFTTGELHGNLYNSFRDIRHFLLESDPSHIYVSKSHIIYLERWVFGFVWRLVAGIFIQEKNCSQRKLRTFLTDCWNDPPSGKWCKKIPGNEFSESIYSCTKESLRQSVKRKTLMDDNHGCKQGTLLSNNDIRGSGSEIFNVKSFS